MTYPYRITDRTTLLRDNLRLSVEERFRRLLQLQRSAEELRKTGRALRARRGRSFPASWLQRHLRRPVLFSGLPGHATRVSLLNGFYTFIHDETRK